MATASEMVHEQPWFAIPARHTAVLVLIAALLCAMLNACSGESPDRRAGAEPSPANADTSGCRVSKRLVPSCGALWGIATQKPTNAELFSTEQAVGRRFDFVYRFHDLDDVVPTDEERQLVQQGRALHISIDTRLYAPRSPIVTWAEVARGDYDRSLRQQAKGIASMQVPVFVTYEHEVDQPRKTALGTPADFRAAYRHVHDLFDKAGADNAIWVWVATGWDGSYARAGSLWPGNKVVDWISWEGYNQSGCQSGYVDPDRYVSFGQAISGFYDWLMTKGHAYGIDTSKPMMISEAGSVTYTGNPDLTARWYAGIPDVLQRYPQIKAIGFWDHTGTGSSACDFRFVGRPGVLAAVTAAGRRPWVDLTKR